MSTPPNNTAKKSPQDKDKTSGTRTGLKWRQSPWVIGVGTAVIAGLLLTAIYGIYHYFNPGPTPAPDLRLSNISVSSANAFPWRPEEVDLTFLNAGTQTAVLTKADIRVQGFTALPAALRTPSGVFLLPDHQYRVMMPLQPYNGQVISVQLSEAANVGGTDDFGLDFTLPPRTQGHVFVYRVEISVQYGKATQPVEVLISLPANPSQAYKCSSQSQSGFCDLLRQPGYRPSAMNQLQG
jgi:hypothetical protein